VRSESAETAVAEARQRLAEAPTPNPAPATAPDAETAETESAERALPDTPRELEAEIARLTRKRDAIGPVNLRAEADREEVGAERDTLLAEKADLEAAIAKLRGAIGSLNREGRQRLTAAFDRVNTAFAGLFRELFGGGEARLVMVEDEDPLEAGLEILCQPPGKKLSSLSLLSGGEQTLTALSLILAVFLCQPSPICVLDEVDAPLDDSNVARFCALLDRMRRETDTRFLVITHHPLTMSRMDRLYGVTMVERGVSQLVSVDLAAAAALVDA
ncbi:MAG: chromosome segregation protein SMC, partial [Pseudomonadota bacterium]